MEMSKLVEAHPQVRLGFELVQQALELGPVRLFARKETLQIDDHLKSVASVSRSNTALPGRRLSAHSGAVKTARHDGVRLFPIRAISARVDGRRDAGTDHSSRRCSGL